jgi:hypothetical protein
LSTRSQISIFVFAIVAIGGWVNFAWLSADQPGTIAKEVPQLPASAEPSQALPSPTPLAPESSNATEDPLYQAIREQLRAGRPSLAPNDHPSIVQSQVAGSNSVTDAEWEAVELMLRAARLLNRPKKQTDANQAVTDHTTIVRQLRASALQILRKELPE